jgi:hypothetical protein
VRDTHSSPRDLFVDPAKAIVGASPIVFGPRTLGRTWGTRPIPSDPAMTRALLEVEDRLEEDAAVAGGRGAEEASAGQ